MSKPFVAIMMGSDSDLGVMQQAIDTLNSLDIKHEVKIASAHRTPEYTHNYIKDADQRGCAAFIAAAGMAAHLAGTVAALTLKPVIGVPIASGALQGFDALLSTVQMPGGTPVATTSIGEAGAKNAAILAAQILALNDAALAQRLQALRASNTEKVIAKDQALQKKLGH